MSEAKKEVKKATITKGEILEFNNAWKDAKVKGLSPAMTKDYLYLKIKMSEHVKAIQKQLEEGQKTLLSELGYKEGESIPKEKVNEVQGKINDVVTKLLDEEVGLDTHIMHSDDLFNCLLNIDENNPINTEGKATIMKYLLKE